MGPPSASTLSLACPVARRCLGRGTRRSGASRSTSACSGTPCRRTCVTILVLFELLQLQLRQLLQLPLLAVKEVGVFGDLGPEARAFRVEVLVLLQLAGVGRLLQSLELLRCQFLQFVLEDHHEPIDILGQLMGALDVGLNQDRQAEYPTVVVR